MKDADQVSRARQAAFDVLLRVETRGAYSHIALRKILRDPGMDVRDRALATEIVYGTLQWQRWLDERIATRSRVPPGRLDPPVRVALRMAVFQLCKLGGVAPYAVVHDAVELIKTVRPRAAGFVNGVLRNLLRGAAASPNPRGEETAPEWDGAPDSPESLARRTSHPDWMVQKWWSFLGPVAAERLCMSNNEPSSLCLRVNRWRSSVSEVARAIREAGGEAEPSPAVPEALRVGGGIDVSAIPAFQSGACTVQDESAMLAAYTVAPEPGWEVLDLCAAPGGKATHLGEWLKGTGRVTAVDIHPHKIPLIAEAARRLGLTNVRPVRADGRDAPELGTFDAVLVDAPCSGLGVLRRRPEIKWRRQPEEISDLVALQRELIEAAGRALRPGGVLVYATCTVIEAENDGVVQAFLQSPAGRDFDAQDPAAHWPAAVRASAIRTRWGRQILPFHFGGDGFYYARMRRRRSAPGKGDPQ